MFEVSRPRVVKRLLISVVFVAIVPVISFCVMKLRLASPAIDRATLQLVTVKSGPLICSVEGLGTLVPEEMRWVAAETNGHVDQIFLRAGAGEN